VRIDIDWGGHRSFLTCPVDGCEWRLSMAEVELRTMVTGFTLDRETMEIVARKQAETTEGVIRQHAESHDVLDYLRTIQRLRTDLAQQDYGIRPHVYDRPRSEG
jgi:hypothetical protein